MVSRGGQAHQGVCKVGFKDLSGLGPDRSGIPESSSGIYRNAAYSSNWRASRRRAPRAPLCPQLVRRLAMCRIELDGAKMTNRVATGTRQINALATTLRIDRVEVLGCHVDRAAGAFANAHPAAIARLGDSVCHWCSSARALTTRTLRALRRRDPERCGRGVARSRPTVSAPRRANYH
jgi:hypothetical protein